MKIWKLFWSKYPTEENKIVQFKIYYRQQKIPFVIYADLESNLVKQLLQKNCLHHGWFT